LTSSEAELFSGKQGDQIGRSFAILAIFKLGPFSLKLGESFHLKGHASDLEKDRLGCSLDDFLEAVGRFLFAKASGHPAAE
jgi:hypothetical protein